MCTTPNETCLRSFFLKVFFLPFSGAAAPPAAAAGFAIFVLRRRWFVVRKSTGACSSGVGQRPTTNDRRRIFRFLPPPSSCSRPFLYAGPCGCERSCAYAARGPEGCVDGENRDRSRFQ